MRKSIKIKAPIPMLRMFLLMLGITTVKASKK